MSWISVQIKLPPKDRYVKVKPSFGNQEFIACHRHSFIDRLLGFDPYWEYLSGLKGAPILDNHFWEEQDDR